MNTSITQIPLLEKELACLIEDVTETSEKKARMGMALLAARTSHPETLGYTAEHVEYCKKNKEIIEQLDFLYFLYPHYEPEPKSEPTPDDDKKLLSYLISDNMTKEQKLKVLGDAYWEATHSGYCDAMANRLMAGQEDAQTAKWEKNCKNKYAINRLYDWIKENEHD